MPVITVPKEFFRQERRNIYGSWRFAFWRELFQNSIDAGADRIEIGISVTGSGKVYVLFSDNGCGMNREVIENVYFKLGETTKGGDSIGGFGRARIVTCFSMESYEIWTQDNHVVGDGAHYEIRPHRWKDGCHLKIVTDDLPDYALRRALDDFLRESDIPAAVFIDGRQPHFGPCERGRHVRKLELNGRPYADVFVNDSGQSNRMLVRVRGVLMYSRYVRLNKQITVEIEPHLSREVLTASRDSLMGDFGADLSKFTDELAVDVESALKERRTRHSTIVHGRARFRYQSRPDRTEERDVPRRASAAFVGRQRPNQTERPTPTVSEIAHPEIDYDVHVVQDTEDAALVRALPRFVPTNWVPMTWGGRTYQKGSTARKLLALWAVACEEAVAAYLRTKRYDPNVSFSIGWIFSDNCRARCDSVDGGRLFLLNPVDGSGKICFKLSDRTDLKRLMALAKHEVAHLVESYHDECYASALTEIDANFDEAVAFRRMKAVK